MFPNWTGWKTVKAVLFVLVALDGWAMTVNEFGPAVLMYAKITAGLLGTLGTVVVGLSGTDAGPTVVKAAVRAGVAILAIGFFAGAVTACTKEQTSAVATVSLDTGICILNHAGDPPATIATECGVATIEDVIRFLDAQHAAMVRASAKCADAGADVGSP